MQYSDFQNLASSEKITLARLRAGKRLMGWTLHTGNVYKLTGFSHQVIAALEDSGTAYTEVSQLADVSPSKFHIDRSAETLYIQTTGSDNPNGRFIVVTVSLFFANVPATLPHDLASGFDVFWEPLVQSSSQFGVEIDTVKQTSEAIEGGGSLTLVNDHEFWPKNFDKLSFENQACEIFSYHRDLEPSDAKLIFSGKVEKKTYSSTTVQFQLKDLIANLKTPLSLGTIADLAERTGDDLALAKQRMILGRVFGHVPVNIDQVLSGYPVTGTVSISYNSATLSGSGTQFLTQLSPDDRLKLSGVEYTVATVASDTSATLTENYANPLGLSGASVLVLPDQPKRWMNRRWHIAGHALRQPVTAIANGSSVNMLFLDDAEDIHDGDWIYVGNIGSGELVRVGSRSGANIVNLATSLATIPPIGTPVTRPAVQKVRINDTELVYLRDYTLNATTATLTLTNTAEANAGAVRQLTSSLSFTSGSRAVTGTGLKNSIKPGYMVGVVGQATFFEVLSVNSDTSLTLRTNSTFTANTTGRYKSLIFDPAEHTLSLDVLGRTEDGLTGGRLLKTAPSIVNALLSDVGLADRVNAASFQEAEDLAPMHLGMVFPRTFDGDDTVTYREMINQANRSVFGSLIQNGAFELVYHVLQPNKPGAAVRFDESDILNFRFESSSEKLTKTSIVEYRRREYDYLLEDESTQTSQKTSDVATYLVKATDEKKFSTSLVDEQDARIIACRWAFILENGAGSGSITTKLQGMDIDIGDVIEVSHRKFFERMGSAQTSRLFLVEAVKRSGSEVTLEVVDLSNAFNRVAAINTQAGSFSSASDDDRLYGGYITDSFGLIDNSPDSFGTNLIW